MLRSIAKSIYRTLWFSRFLLPVMKNKVVVVCFYGRGFSDHPKYIVESLYEARPDLKVYWAIDKKSYKSSLPHYVRPIRYKSVAYVFHMVTARMWIDNSRKPSHEKKRDGQLYMQVWHTGNACLKRVERHAESKLSQRYLADAINDAGQTDVMVSGSEFTDKCFRDGFWYPTGEILSVGSPRNDIFFKGDSSDKAIAKVRSYLQLPKGTQILLYAPTFRDNDSLSHYDLNFQEIVNSFELRFGGSWILALRLHPNAAESSARLKAQDLACVVDVTYYDDMQELLVASDALITDYSSSVFDFMITKRPILVHATDHKEYIDERGLYFDLKELPFYYSQTLGELVRNIESFDRVSYQNDCSSFMQRNGFYDDGSASKKVAEWIDRNL